MDAEPVLWDSDLEEFLERALHRPSVNEGRTHVFIGDSIAKNAPVRVSEPNLLLRLERNGHSWKRLAATIGEDIATWRRAANSYGRPLGRAIIWMTGNDLYPKHGNMICGLDLNALSEDAAAAVSALNAVAEGVDVLGPLPRYRFDRDKTWTQTPAYLGERCLRHCLTGYEGVTVENLGRTLTVTRGKCKALVPSVRMYFSEDLIHLSSQGYRKVMDKMPEWLVEPPKDEL